MPCTRFHIGTSGYAYPAWKRSFYPKDLPASRMLEYYAQHFGAVEINNTFYRLPRPAVLRTWATQVPREFVFALKAPQRITHFQRLKNARRSVNQFLRVASVLKDQLGPLLFQLPPNFKKDVQRLRDFLKIIPADFRVAFEFRHLSWFDEEMIEVLRERAAVLCVAQEDDDIGAPLVRTADWGYVRLRRTKYGDARLKTWIRRIDEQNWPEAFVFFKHEDTGTGPRFGARMIKLLKR